MSWSHRWEEIFSENEWGRYPAESLVRFVARNYYKVQSRESIRILELGCGPGANIWYMAREGFSVTGIDGSATAIRQARDRLDNEGLSDHTKLLVGDILDVRALVGGDTFDAVIDVNCLQCMPLRTTVGIVADCRELLKDGGQFFSVMMATGSWGEGFGEEIAPGTFKGISVGPNNDSVLNHFANDADCAEIFAGFSMRSKEYQVRSFEEGTKELKHWVIQAQKNEHGLS